MISFQALRHELRPTIRLALPLVLAEIGWMSMGMGRAVKFRSRGRKIPTLKKKL